MHRRSIHKRQLAPPFNSLSCERKFYSVLATVSGGCPHLMGRLPTCYSPVRRSPPRWFARLACIRHAASVHPEPGSNSPLSFSIFRQFHVFLTLSFFLSLLTCLLFSFQCPCALSSSAHL